MSQKAPRSAVIALVVSLLVVFVLVPAISWMPLFATAIAVLSSAALAWFLRDRKALVTPETVAQDGEIPEGPVYQEPDLAMREPLAFNEKHNVDLQLRFTRPLPAKVKHPQ